MSRFDKPILAITVIAFLNIIVFCSAVQASNIEINDPPVIASVDTLLFEDFNGPEGPFTENNLPGWTVIDSGVPEWDATSWSRYENNSYPQWNGDLARVMFSSAGAVGDWFITPTIDCSNDNALTFSFKQRHANRTSSDNDTIFVYGSTDNGRNWEHTVYMSTESVGSMTQPDTVEFDISSWAGGMDSVRLAYYFKGNDVLTWYIDEPFIGGDVTDTLLYEDFNGSWGPYGNNPPSGWYIINVVIDPPNDNDWGRWYYSTWPETVARAYDNQNNQTADEWLITPALSFPEVGICSLSFYNNYWDHSFDPSDSAIIVGSTNGGLTWDHPIVVYTNGDDGSTIKANSWRGFDISSWAQNQDSVLIAFHYVKDDPSYLGWWFVDDVNVTATPILDDNVAAISIDYPNEFIVVDDEYFVAATIHNLSITPQTFDLNLIVLDELNNEVLNYIETDVALDSAEIDQISFGFPFYPASEGLHTFTVIVQNPGDEDLTDDTTSVMIMSYQHQGTGGPDSYGYQFIDNSMPNGPEFNWIEISGTGTQVNPGEHYFMSGAIPIGFNFNFYGTDYSNIWINSHGELHLGMRDVWLGSNDCPLPDLSTPNAPLLAVFWDMLNIHYEIGQGVYYQMFGDPGSRYFVVEWQAEINNVETDSIVFEAVLYENGEILFQYNYVNDDEGGRGQAATIGMEYDVLPSGLVYNCDDSNPANRLEAGLAIKWYHEPSNVNDDESIIPKGYSLSQNYPNPFNAQTTIFFELPKPGFVNIQIVDLLGRVVEDVVHDYIPAGKHQVSWDAHETSSGVYFIKMNADDFQQARKMLLIK
jgi:hypothetical protein